MKADLHVHSKASPDGTLSVPDIVKELSRRGFQGVAILDHNAIGESKEANDIAKEHGMILIRGIEISSSEGHIGAMRVYEPIPRNLTPEETIDRIHGQGGIAIAVHPYRWRTGLGEKVVRRCKFDVVETINGRTNPPGNRKASQLCESLGLPPTAGSDSHVIEELGKSFVVIDNNCESEDELIESILQKRVKVGGECRSLPETIKYGKKAVFEWVQRGFRDL